MEEKLPSISSKELLKILSKIGYKIIRQRGSHISLKSPHYPLITVPNHNPIAKGTLREIIKQIWIERERFAIPTTAHELGHTHGLCDEYLYEYWEKQNSTREPDGCPNPYPEECPKECNLLTQLFGSCYCEGKSCGPNCRCIMGPGLAESVERKYCGYCKSYIGGVTR